MKKLFGFAFFVLFASFLIVSCNSDDNFIEQGGNIPEEIQLNVSYGEHPQQVYDLYLPEGRTPQTTKVIMLIHGGGWISGDKADMDEAVLVVRERHPEYAVVNVNYVLANEETPAFPNQFLDIHSVIEQLTEKSESLRIHPAFGIIGVSAGAHIALMYDYVYDTEDRVKFIADIVGPTDFTDPFYTNNPDFSMMLEFLVDESQYPEDTDLVEAVSPVYQVSASSSSTLMFYGMQDPLVPVSNAYSLKNALDDASVTNSLMIYSGGHGDDWEEVEIMSMYLKISEYINMYLGM